MIIEIVEALSKAKKGISPEVDRALGKYELPMGWRKLVKYLKTWLKR